MTNEDRLEELLNIEEKNDIFNLTRKERREFQIWVKNLLEKEEPVSAEGEYIKKEELLNSVVIQDSPYGDFEEKVVTIEDIEKLPTYSFPDREKGEWIINDDGTITYKTYRHKRSKSDCGADMRGKANE